MVGKSEVLGATQAVVMARRAWAQERAQAHPDPQQAHTAETQAAQTTQGLWVMRRAVAMVVTAACMAAHQRQQQANHLPAQTSRILLPAAQEVGYEHSELIRILIYSWL